MLRLAADENFDNRIVRGLWRRVPELDIVRVQDNGLSGADDPAVLEWVAQEGRVLLARDTVFAALERVEVSGFLKANLYRERSISLRQVLHMLPNYEEALDMMNTALENL